MPGKQVNLRLEEETLGKLEEIQSHFDELAQRHGFGVKLSKMVRRTQAVALGIDIAAHMLRTGPDGKTLLVALPREGLVEALAGIAAHAAAKAVDEREIHGGQGIIGSKISLDEIEARVDALRRDAMLN